MTKDSQHLLGVYSIVSDEDGHDLQVEIGVGEVDPVEEAVDVVLLVRRWIHLPVVCHTFS